MYRPFAPLRTPETAVWSSRNLVEVFRKHPERKMTMMPVHDLDIERPSYKVTAISDVHNIHQMTVTGQFVGINSDGKRIDTHIFTANMTLIENRIKMGNVDLSNPVFVHIYLLISDRGSLGAELTAVVGLKFHRCSIDGVFQDFTHHFNFIVGIVSPG